MRMRRDVGSKVMETWPGTHVDYHDSLLGTPGPDMLSDRYDGILIAHDLAMPSESGLAWLREMCDAGPMPPAILLTDSSESIVAETALQNGACACLLIEQLSADTLRDVCARNWSVAQVEFPTIATPGISSDTVSLPSSTNASRMPGKPRISC